MLQPAYFHSVDFSINMDFVFLGAHLTSKEVDILNGEKAFSVLKEIFNIVHGGSFDFNSPLKESGALLQMIIRHEQRHFVDHVVTNYGARRIYHNLVVLAYGQKIIDIGRKYGKVLVPLDAYADRLLIDRYYRLDRDDADQLEVIGNLLAGYRESFEMDRSFARNLSPSFPIDGVALLEALAEGFECLSVSSFSAEFLDKYEDIRSRLGKMPYFRAVIEYLLSQGVPILDRNSESDVAVVEGRLLYPILIASLMAREWNAVTNMGSQRRSEVDNELAATMPSVRFAIIVRALSEQNAIDVVSTEQAFELVDKICIEKLGGHPLLEVMSEHCDVGDGFIEALDDNHAAKVFFLDFQEARRAALQSLREDPAILLSPMSLNQCVPRILLRDQNASRMMMFYDGDLNSALGSVEESCGFRVLDYNAFQGGIRNFVTAKTLEPAGDEFSPRFLRKTFRRSGLEAIRKAAPVIDLLINGKVLMLEREEMVDRAEKELNDLGIIVEIDTAFKIPRFNRREPTTLDRMFVSKIYCALSGEVLEKGGCILVSSTELQSRSVVERLTSLLGEDKVKVFLDRTRKWGFVAMHERYEDILNACA